MSTNSVNVAIVGATGVVGREMLEILEERNFPYSNLRLLASAKSAGQVVETQNGEYVIEELTENSFKEVDIALFSAGASVSEKYGPIARSTGCIVIDNSSFFRMNEEIPLIVPEVNSRVLREYIQNLKEGEGAIIANPNCSTIQLAVVLNPLHKKIGLKRVVVSTYQSVSGAGKQGLDELWDQTLAIFNQTDLTVAKFSKQIAFNVIPHCDVFLDSGYTKEEVKVIKETRKILDIPNLKITATAVRVPVFSCHSESVNVELQSALSADECRSLLQASPGIIVLDNPSQSEYPHAIDLSGTDATYVGRIREDESVDNGLNFWVVADNLRKGAALNAVQIAEIVLSTQQPH